MKAANRKCRRVSDSGAGGGRRDEGAAGTGCAGAGPGAAGRTRVGKPRPRLTGASGQAAAGARGEGGLEGGGGVREIQTRRDLVVQRLAELTSNEEEGNPG